MGERLSLPTEIKVLMQNTGTSHLMAISGLHIALAASLIMLLLRGVQYILPGRWIGWRLPLVAGLAGAVGYAWLTGMQPPALRTCLGLAVCCALRLSGQRWTAWQVWLCCLGAILVADPLAVLSQSLWLSAFAVAGLIFWFQWLPLPAGRWRWPWKTIIALVHLQAGVTLLLLPLQLLLFHGISLTSMAANLLAVPLVTLLAVPLILTAMLVHLRAGVSGVATLAGGRSRAGATVLGITTFTGRLVDAGYSLAVDQYPAVAVGDGLAFSELAAFTGAVSQRAVFTDAAIQPTTACGRMAGDDAGCRTGAGDGDRASR